MLFRSLVISALALSAAAVDCPRCEKTDVVGEFLVAQSGGTRGTPLFCGYSTDATGAAGPQTTCFFGTDGSPFSNNDAKCPTTAPIQDAC
ncbi:hypothetical protein C8R43DRAFT_1128606 [Mycena crocata]|nr:hypothetical protein C8R43DRAFT_1128606 [Mycena crocata]